MRKIYSVRAFLTLCILAVSSLIGGVSAMAQKWVATDISELVTGDVIVIADVTSARAMSNNNGTSKAPAAASITLNTDKTEITGEVADNLKWSIEVENGKYKFAKNGETTNYLYCTSSNNGVRVGTNTANTFTWDAATDKLKNVGTSRWIGVYNNQDWRCYTNTTGNIKGTVTKFFKYVVEEGETPEFSVSLVSYKMNVGAIQKITVKTNSGGALSYESDDKAVAEVDEDGNITAKSEGTVNITVKLGADKEGGFKSATTSFNLTVVDPNKPAAVVTPMQFKKVTSTEQLINGGQYVIVCEGQNVVNGGYNTSYLNSVETTVSALVIDVNESFGIITLTEYAHNWSLKLGDKYIGKENADNKLNTSEFDSGNDYKWTIEFDEEGNALIKSVSQNTYQMAYNSGAPRFSSYKSVGSSTLKVQLYRLEAVATINEKIGYTTYYTDEKYQMPEGLTGYAITKAQEAGAVVMTPAYEAGADVPANTALLIGGEAGTYGLPVLNKEVEATYTEKNLLEGRRTVDNVTNSAHEDVFYYKLTLLNGENPGFYWGAADGAAFEMKSATTAYLAVSKSVPGVNGFRLIMGEGDTTGIGTAATAPAAQDAAIYTLSGVRVNAATTAGLPKGIYIVNGKKLLVK